MSLIFGIVVKQFGNYFRENDGVREFKPHIFALVFASVLLMPVSRPAQAQKWQVLDKLGEVNTSKCIGDPKTPMCAVETYFACDWWNDGRFCEAVGADLQRNPNRNLDRPGRLLLHAYRETGRLILREDDLPLSGFKNEGKAPEVGDTAIATTSYLCLPDLVCLEKQQNAPDEGRSCRSLNHCHVWPDEVVTIVRQTGARWSYVGTYFPSDFRRSFEKRK